MHAGKPESTPMTLNDKLALAIDGLIAVLLNHNDQLVKAQAALSSAQSDIASAQAAQKASDDKAASLEQQVKDLQDKVASELDPAPVEDLITKIQGITSANTNAPAPVALAEPAEPVSVPVATSVNDLVAAAVPDADPAHIQAAVVAHDDAVASGSERPAAQDAAANAAFNAGAPKATAIAIATAIPAPSAS